jgi:hypothetical protein
VAYDPRVNCDQLRTTQAPLKDRYRDEPQATLVTLAASGRLDEGISLDKLLELTERYCVVYQTLASGPALATSLTTR